MIDYDTSKEGIQNTKGWKRDASGAINFGPDSYLHRKQRKTQYRDGATPQQLYKAAQKYGHSLEAVRDMFRYQLKHGDKGSKGMFLGLNDGTSNEWGKGMDVLDLAYSLYEKGYDTTQINDIIVGAGGKFRDVGPASGSARNSNSWNGMFNSDNLNALRKAINVDLKSLFKNV